MDDLPIQLTVEMERDVLPSSVLRTLVEALSFTGGLKLWSPTVEFFEDTSPYDLPTIRFGITVPDRGLSGDWVPIEILEVVPDGARLTMLTFVKYVRSRLRTLVVHELDEGLMLGDKRPFDPHAATLLTF